jgi:hypothetical protein
VAHEVELPPEIQPGQFQCEKCERTCEAWEIDVCPACNKKFCDFCVFRIGGHAYCGRECGVRYFFASDEEDEDADD